VFDAADGDLFDKITDAGCFTQAQSSEIIRPVLATLAFLHGRCVAFRDVKPENLWLVGGAPRLCDFGCAGEFNPTDDPPMATKMGTPYYSAPQVTVGNYTCKAECWSAGVFLYVMLCG